MIHPVKTGKAPLQSVILVPSLEKETAMCMYSECKFEL